MLTTNQIPIPWTPGATARTVERFLKEVLPEDAISLVEELIGYALYPGNPFRKAVMLLGPGGNGKSVLLRLIAALLGKENVAAVPIQTMGEDRFAASSLFGKLANICGDLDARAIQRTDLFKQVTGGDPIFAQKHPGKCRRWTLIPKMDTCTERTCGRLGSVTATRA